MRIPVCRSVSTAAQVQNARSSSPVRSRRFPVDGSTTQIRALPTAAVACAVVNLAAVMVRMSLSRATSMGSTGSRSRVRWSVRDLRDRISFCRARSSARIGHGAAHGAHRDGSSIAHWAISR